MKLCKTCNRSLPLDAFHKKKTGKQGRNSKCKECKSGYDHIRHERDSERLTKLACIRQKENPVRTSMIQSKRRAAKFNNPIPKEWPPHDKSIEKAMEKKKHELGAKKYHLEHIVPLSRGGPHHHWNLRITEAKPNLSKNSKLDEEIGKVLYCFYREKPYTISICNPSVFAQSIKKALCHFMPLCTTEYHCDPPIFQWS